MASVTFSRPGCYDLKVLCEDVEVITRCFTVLPRIPERIGCKTIRGLSVQTLIVNCMGKIDEWPKHFETASRSGYTAIHLTPVQPLGSSGSAYSICDQVDISDALFTTKLTRKEKIKKLKQVLDECRKKYNLLFFCDAIFPHGSSDTVWLKDHPDAGYTPPNSPHLKLAFVVDCLLKQFTAAVENGAYGKVDDDTLRKYDGICSLTEKCMNDFVLPGNLWQFYVIDVDTEVEKFKAFLKENNIVETSYTGQEGIDELTSLFSSYIIRDSTQFRFSRHVNKELYKILIAKGFSDTSAFRLVLDKVNVPFYGEYDSDIASIRSNVQAQAVWNFCDTNGPRFPKICTSYPFAASYFTVLKGDIFNTKFETLDQLNAIDAVVNHGWVMNADVFKDNAGPNSTVYQRREVIAWSDCFKLRYGQRKEDNPWVWEHMKEYAEFLSSIFDGFRLDKCHSVPLQALRYLMRAATTRNKNLIVLSELFAPNQEDIRRFAAIAGIHALLKEGNSPQSTKELSHFFYDSCGPLNNPIGAPQLPLSFGTSANFPLLGWVFDCTHDNQPPIATRRAEDALPLGALVSMANAPLGSVRGYDELMPFLIDVVHERRTYQTVDWTKKKVPGIMHQKCVFNTLHKRMDREGFTQSYGEESGLLVSAARHNPTTHQTISTFVYPAYKYSDFSVKSHPAKSVAGIIKKILFVGTIKVERVDEQVSASKSSPKNLVGLAPEIEWAEDLSPEAPNKFVKIEIDEANNQSTISFLDFPPGSVLCVEAELSAKAKMTITGCQAGLRTIHEKRDEIFKSVTALSLNKLLFRCREEEESEYHRGTYDPGNGPLVYAGIYGFYHAIYQVISHYPIDMGNALLSNIRNGNWALDYIVNRIKDDPSLHSVSEWLDNIFGYLRSVPSYLKPKYFADIISAFFQECESYATKHLLGRFIANSNSNFVRKLGMGTLVFVAQLSSCPFLSKDLAPDAVVSMSAGLPHFSTGYMRNWGRDTFISLNGILLATERYNEAKQMLLNGLAVTNYHLIPNLIDSGVNPRYNARDATWFLLNALVEYVRVAPDGDKIFSEKVHRLFPEPHLETCAETILDIITGHANGIHFREKNAGRKIDDRMQDDGFNIDIYRDEKTGFLCGGNTMNCGTWMDKMGESSRAGNRGIPATPRVGAPIEITALLYNVLRSLQRLSCSGRFPRSGVTLESGQPLRFSEWADKIEENFMKYYFIPSDAAQDAKHMINKNLVNKRGIFKDVAMSVPEWAEYQLRPNMCVAMAVAPELFSSHRQEACSALDSAEKFLLGPLGIRTLDPSDWNYNGDYTSTDSDEYKTAGGFNYHNGPEWLWVFGSFLKAVVLHRHSSVHRYLDRHAKYIENCPWLSLPELTNTNGSYCSGSCEAQAWSIGCILEALYTEANIINSK